MNTLAHHFASFRAATIPASAGPHQVADMKVSFYAGATSMLTLMTLASEGTDDIGVTRLAQIEQELADFARGLGGTTR